MFPLHFHEKAKKEFEDSAQWYNDQLENLGERFVTAIREVLDEIQKRPETYGYLKRPFRQAVVKTFPFLIVYNFDRKNGVVNISAIYHAKRKPGGKFRI